MSSKLIELNTDGLFSEALLYACPANTSRLAAVQKDFSEWTRAGAEGEIKSGYRKECLERFGLSASVAMAKTLREEFEALVVLGIGGSALGARTGISALQWGVPEGQRRKVFILDNLDPIDFEQIWSQIDPAKTAFAIVTKSGGTIETLAQTSVILDRLAALKLDFTKHFVAITDPQSGVLRKWVESTSMRNLAVPSSVGGRFSVLTPVGLLPMAFAGINVEALVEGAVQQFSSQLIDPEQIARLGMRLAELESAGYIGHVLMPYATLLKDFGAWFVQLWGESLGKTRKDRGAVGPIPVAGVGATDQHSLLQLLMEGPSRLISGFVTVQNWPPFGSRNPVMSKLPSEFAGLSFAFGKSFGEILNAEAKATRTVLAQKGRPVYELSIKEPSPAALGALFAFYMDLTTYTGAAHGINPYDQPGVEAGKKILPSLLS